MKIVSNKPTITRKELEMVLDCLINEELATGASVKTFEAHLATMTDQKYALATSSLTAAYHLIFLALDIHEGDEVVIPSFFDQAPLAALSLTGGTAVLVDIDENAYFPSPEMIQEKITERTRAVIIGHTFGFHADIERIVALNVPVIEDISHAVGTELNEKSVGNLAAFTVASFAPANIITTGNGGIAMTRNSKYFAVMRDKRGANEALLNLDYTMTDFQGAMGISQLLKLKDFIRRRREIARVYFEAMKITSHRCPLHYAENYAFQTFPVVFDAPVDKVEKYWKKIGIEVSNPVSVPLHVLKGERNVDYPLSDRFSKKLFSLPLYPTLTKKDIEKIAKALASFI